MELSKIYDDFEKLRKDYKLPVRYCNTCNKKMREIKNDYHNRKSCKSCYFKNLKKN